MSILSSSTDFPSASTMEIPPGTFSNGSEVPISPNNEPTTLKEEDKTKNVKDLSISNEPEASQVPKDADVANAPKESQQTAESQGGKSAKQAKQTKVKAPKAPKPPKAPEQSFPEKLGSDLAEGLVKDPRLLENSLNLVDRVSFVKLPQAATVQVIDDDEDQSPDPSLASAFETAGEPAPKPTKDEKARLKEHESRGLDRETYDLNDFAALASLQELVSQYGRVSHMGILDPSYKFFITKDRKAALYYKIKSKVAVVGGDPLCPTYLFPFVLSEFEKYRKKRGLGLAFLGAGQNFVDYARSQKYTTMCFAYERVLNPMTNPVLHSNAGKSITRIARNLLDPKKDGLKLEVYTPALGKNALLQQQLVNVYEAWRNARNDSGRPQAYITVYDPFALPELMTYIYTTDRYGHPNGFAALRILGAEKGYHLDPYVAAPGSPTGITDLLIYGTMSLLNTAKISYLSLGYEPLDDLGEIRGIPEAFKNITRKVHKRIFDGLHVAGKKAYHDKFHPDPEQQHNLYLVFPPGLPSLRHMSALVHVANIKIRKTIFKMPGIENPISGIYEKAKEQVDDVRLRASRSSSRLNMEGLASRLSASRSRSRLAMDRTTDEPTTARLSG